MHTNWIIYIDGGGLFFNLFPSKVKNLVLPVLPNIYLIRRIVSVLGVCSSPWPWAAVAHGEGQTTSEAESEALPTGHETGQSPKGVIYRFQLLLSASPIRSRHSGFSISMCSYLLHATLSLQPLPCPLSPHPYTSCQAFPVSSFLATPSSESFSQYTHHLSSVHVHTTSVSPLGFSLQPVL